MQCRSERPQQQTYQNQRSLSQAVESRSRALAASTLPLQSLLPLTAFTNNPLNSFSLLALTTSTHNFHSLLPRKCSTHCFHSLLPRIQSLLPLTASTHCFHASTHCFAASTRPLQPLRPLTASTLLLHSTPSDCFNSLLLRHASNRCIHAALATRLLLRRRTSEFALRRMKTVTRSDAKIDLSHKFWSVNGALA